MIDKILEDRQEQYGDAGVNFATIGRMWGAILHTDDITPEEVALMMVAVKTARLIQNPTHSDSWDDIIGYVHHARKIVGA